jgi:bacteriocin-like protein
MPSNDAIELEELKQDPNQTADVEQELSDDELMTVSGGVSSSGSSTTASTCVTSVG